MRTSTQADLSLVGVTLIWGFSFLIVKSSLQVVTPFWFIFLRFLVAAATLWLLFPQLWRQVRPPTLLYSGVVACFLYGGFTFQTLGLQHTTPAKSAFITAVSILLVPLLNLVIFRVRLRPALALGVALAFWGLYLLIHPQELTRPNRGDALTLACAVAFGFHIIFIGRYATRVPFQQLAVFQIVWALLLSGPLGLLWETPRFSYPISFHLSLAYLGVLSSALAFFVQTRAQQYTSAARTALIFSLEPVFAALASVMFYGERLNLREWVGGALIVVGILVGEMPVLKSKNERVNQSNV